MTKAIKTIFFSILFFFIIILITNFLEKKNINTLNNLICAVSVKIKNEDLSFYCKPNYDYLYTNHKTSEIIFDEFHTINKDSLKTNDLLTKKDSGDIRRNHKDYSSSNFYNSNYYNKKNASSLGLIWNYEYEDIEDYYIQSSPIYYKGYLITTTSKNSIMAIDFETKTKVWEINEKGPIAQRGLIIDLDFDGKDTLFINYADGLLKVDPLSGKIKNKIKHNPIKAIQVLSKYSSLKNLEGKISVVPPIIDGDNVIVSYTNADLVSYNLKTTKINWSVSLRKNNDLYGASNWGGMSYYEDKRIIFITTGNPRTKSLANFAIGVNRKGSNLYANSLVAIDANNGEILWYYQDVIHDLWDLDLSFPPILSNLSLDNKITKIVSIVGKSGNVLSFEAISGKLINDLKKVEVLKSTIPNEVTSPIQPHSIKPKKLINMKINENELAKFNQEIYDYNIKQLNSGLSEEYQPPIINGDIYVRGPTGGGQWYGGSIDNNGILYVQINNSPFKISVKTTLKGKGILNDLNKDKYLNLCSSCHGANRDSNPSESSFLSLVGITLLKYLDKDSLINAIKLNHKEDYSKEDLEKITNYFFNEDIELKKKNKILLESTFGYMEDQFGNLSTSPPYSSLYAIDLNKGEINWKKNLGKIKINLGDGNFQEAIGSPSYGGLISNSGGLIFASGYYDSNFYVLNKSNGKILHSIKLGAPGSAPPIIFKHKEKEFIAINATGTLKSKGMKRGLFILGEK